MKTSRTSLAVAAGCLMVVVGAASLTGQSGPTFYKDVLPILQTNCQTCHRPGEVAPMSLLTYEQARPWAQGDQDEDRRRSRCRRGLPIPTYGLFANERKLSDARDRRRSPRGPTRARRRATRKTRRPRGTSRTAGTSSPTSIVEMPKPFELPATGTINYKYIVVKTNFKEDMWVVAAEMRPGNPTVLHHGKVWVRPPGSTWMKDAVPGEAYENETQRDIIGRNSPEEGNDILGKFNPGLGAQRFDQEGAAKFVPKGSDLVFEMHYTAIGQSRRPMCRSSDSCSRRSRPKKRYYFHAGPTASNLAIPAGDGNAEVVSEVTLGEPTRASSTRSRTCICAARTSSCASSRPGGESKTVLKGNFDFEWQMGYQYAEPVAAAEGREAAVHHALRQLAGQPVQPGSDEEGRLGSPELGRDEQLLHRRPVRSRRQRRRKAFLRSGAEPAAARRIRSDARGRRSRGGQRRSRVQRGGDTFER